MTPSHKLIPGDSLPDADHVLRYIGRKFVDDEGLVTTERPVDGSLVIVVSA
jgi:hypothetical protein